MNLFFLSVHVAATRKIVSWIWRIGGYFYLLALLTNGAVQAQTFPENFTQVTVATGLVNPTVVAFAPNGRIFVAHQNGTLRLIKNGDLLPKPFVQLTVDSTGERGLLGIAFDPAFATNQFVYLYYTVPASETVEVHNRVSRFTASGDTILAGSETVILELEPATIHHNGGALGFGADQKLYIAVGDNGTPANSQNLDNSFGKLLRINADGSIPSDNPFPTGSEIKKRIWSYGLRNPFTLAIQPGTGRLLLNDVGEYTWEEIDDATTGGQNFGWPDAEGNSYDPHYINPIYTYLNNARWGDAIGCAITGGTFYNPATVAYPKSFVGKYFLQDFCHNWIDVLDLSSSTPTRSSFAANLPGEAVSLTVGTDGALYYLSRANAALYKIVYLGESCTTVSNGNWHDAAVWSCGRVPLLTDRAVVGHVITIEAGSVGQASQVRYATGGQVRIMGNGKLQVTRF